MINTNRMVGTIWNQCKEALVWLQVEAALTNDPDSEELKKLKTDLEVHNNTKATST